MKRHDFSQIVLGALGLSAVAKKQVQARELPEISSREEVFEEWADVGHVEGTGGHQPHGFVNSVNFGNCDIFFNGKRVGDVIGQPVLEYHEEHHAYLPKNQSATFRTVFRNPKLVRNAIDKLEIKGINLSRYKDMAITMPKAKVIDVIHYPLQYEELAFREPGRLPHKCDGSIGITWQALYSEKENCLFRIETL